MKSCENCGRAADAGYFLCERHQRLEDDNQYLREESRKSSELFNLQEDAYSLRTQRLEAENARLLERQRRLEAVLTTAREYVYGQMSMKYLKDAVDALGAVYPNGNKPELLPIGNSDSSQNPGVKLVNSAQSLVNTCTTLQVEMAVNALPLMRRIMRGLDQGVNTVPNSIPHQDLLRVVPRLERVVEDAREKLRQALDAAPASDADREGGGVK